MIALILGDAMRLVSASERRSLNASLSAIYQTGGTIGGIASARLYGISPRFAANVVVSFATFLSASMLLQNIAKMTSLEKIAGVIEVI